MRDFTQDGFIFVTMSHETGMDAFFVNI